MLVLLVCHQSPAGSLTRASALELHFPFARHNVRPVNAELGFILRAQ